MKKCNLKRCKARCCYNIPFEKRETEVFKDFIVNPLLSTHQIAPGAILAITEYNPEKNKCPFLREDCKCNIYHNRPEVCRLMGEIPRLSCPDFR